MNLGHNTKDYYCLNYKGSGLYRERCYICRPQVGFVRK